jgi:N-methylhydantoinase A
VATFHDAHQALYGYAFRHDPAQQVEWVNLRVTGVGPIRRPTLRPAPDRGAKNPHPRVPGPPEQGVPHPHPRVPGAPDREGNPGPDRASGAVHSPIPTTTTTPTTTPTPVAIRPACFAPSSGFVDTAIYRRDDLEPGDQVEGPAVVEEYGATVPLHPGFRAEVDGFGNLVVTRQEPGPGEPGAAP